MVIFLPAQVDTPKSSLMHFKSDWDVLSRSHYNFFPTFCAQTQTPPVFVGFNFFSLQLSGLFHKNRLRTSARFIFTFLFENLFKDK